MRFSLEITRTRPAPGQTKGIALAHPVGDSRGWWPLIREPRAGAWQRGQQWSAESVLAHHAVFACITLIASDVGKLRAKLVKLADSGIWEEIHSGAFSPVLLKPNRYQNHIQFKEWWILSKLTRGNTYALKVRDQRGVVVALYLLDPTRVQVLVAPDGSVFYQLMEDNLSGLTGPTPPIPASEIIHDRMNCLFHPLVGVSPLFACGLSAQIGLSIQENSDAFFSLGSNPSGVLTAPGEVDEATCKRISEEWQAQFSGQNAGKVAVLGEGLKFEPMRMTAVDSQLIEQLKWSAETVCSAFHVPPFKVGIGAAPTYPNAVEGLNQIYYSDCLQAHIESMELCLDEGLGLLDPKEGRQLGVELDLSSLLRMDPSAQVKSLAEGIGGALFAPNEARKQMDLPPLPGGDSVYMQQQNYSLEALSKRDEGADPFGAAQRTPTPPESDDPDVDDETAKSLEDTMLDAFMAAAV